MFSNDNISLMCKRLVYEPSEILGSYGAIVPYREVAIGFLISYLCELSGDVKRRKAVHQARRILEVPVHRIANVLWMVHEEASADRKLFGDLDAKVRYELTSSNVTSWAMALVLYEAAPALGEQAHNWIRYGYKMAGTPPNRTYAQIAYASLYNYVGSRAGDESARITSDAVARSASMSPSAYEDTTLDRAYSHFADSA